MLEKLSKIISHIFHPLLVPTVGFLVLFNSGTYLSYLPFNIKAWITSIVFVCTFFIPLMFILFLKYQEIINNIQMTERKDRYIPIIITFLLFVFCFYLIRRIDIPSMFYSFMLGGLISLLITFFITIRFKISIHMVGLGGLMALIIFISFYLKVNLTFYLILAALLAGMTGSARLQLKAHTPVEIYSGFVMGFVAVLATMMLY
jgi:membrane-associated phospholipid phosphatase